MENIINQLIEIGYDRFQAEKIYDLYDRRGKLQDLIDYLLQKQLINIEIFES